MPIYSYLCHDCSFEFDEVRRFDADETKIECPHCEAPTAYKLPSLPGGYRGNFGSSSTSPKGKGTKLGKPLNFVKDKK